MLKYTKILVAFQQPAKFFKLLYNGAMKKTGLLWSIGLILIVTPFLGLPENWKNVIFVLLGTRICFLAFEQGRRGGKARHRRERALEKPLVAGLSETFVESGPARRSLGAGGPALDDKQTAAGVSSNNHAETPKI